MKRKGGKKKVKKERKKDKEKEMLRWNRASFERFVDVLFEFRRNQKLVKKLLVNQLMHCSVG